MHMHQNPLFTFLRPPHSSPSSHVPDTCTHVRMPQGEQERELVRVTLDCCLQEAAWNPYYAHLALKLTSASKSHKVVPDSATPPLASFD